MATGGCYCVKSGMDRLYPLLAELQWGRSLSRFSYALLYEGAKIGGY